MSDDDQDKLPSDVEDSNTKPKEPKPANPPRDDKKVEKDPSEQPS